MKSDRDGNQTAFILEKEMEDYYGNSINRFGIRNGYREYY